MSISVDNSSQDRYMEMIRQRQEEIRRAEEQRRAEEERRAEEKRKAEEERRAEEQRKAEEAKSIFDFEEDDNSVSGVDKEDDNSIFGGYYEDSTETVGVADEDEAQPVEASYSATAQRTASGSDLDGNIDASAQSAYTGDCWLLTGLNSMSYSEAGRQAIKDAMTFNDDGSVTVNFKGLGVSYTVSAEQIAAANKSAKYSYGDDDVLVFEMAIEQLRNDIGAGKIKFDVNSPYYVSDTSTGRSGQSSIDGGFVEQVWYLLTGKLAQTTSNPSEVNRYLDKFEQNPDSTTMSCSFKGGQGDRNGFTVRDVNGNPVQLYYSHAYAVKSVDGDKVTIVNPWDSTQEIVLDRNTFAQYANLSYSDLSDNNRDMSGAFSRIAGYISGVVEDIATGIRDVINNIFHGGSNSSNAEDLFAKEIIEDMIDGKSSTTKSTNKLDAYIRELIEKYNRGEITKEELEKKIKILKASFSNPFSGQSTSNDNNNNFQNQFSLEFQF